MWMFAGLLVVCAAGRAGRGEMEIHANREPDRRRRRTEDRVRVDGRRREAGSGVSFLCERTNGGDFLILRANTDDDYAQSVNKEIFAMCPLNSAATIVFDDREDSADHEIAADHRSRRGNFHRGRRSIELFALLAGHAGAGCAQSPYCGGQTDWRLERGACSAGRIFVCVDDRHDSFARGAGRSIRKQDYDCRASF